MDINFISFADLTTDANYLYCSESVIDVLGYAPSELIGRPSYDICHPDEIPSIHLVHASGIQADKVAVMVNLRMLHKRGHWVDVEVVFNICFDVIVSSTTLRRRSGTARAKVRSATAEEVNTISYDGQLEVRGWNKRQMRMLEAINQKFEWDVSELSTEPRACMILNRFTRDSTIMYTSSASEFLLGVDCERATGTSFLSYIHPDELTDVATELDMAKANDSIAHLKFNFLSLTLGSIIVEAVVSCSSDGLVVVIRRCPDDPIAPRTRNLSLPQDDSDSEDPNIESVQAAARLGVYVWHSVPRPSSLE